MGHYTFQHRTALVQDGADIEQDRIVGFEVAVGIDLDHDVESVLLGPALVDHGLRA